MKTRQTLEALTVGELRNICTELGLPKEHKGKKFKKSELIDNILKVTTETAEPIAEIKAEPENGSISVAINTDASVDATEQNETEKPEKVVYVNVNEKNRTKKPIIAKTFDELVEKYKYPKPQFIYDVDLKVGSFVVFVHYVEAIGNGEIYKKLRTAKVTAVNRKKKLIRCVTLLGTEFELSFSELLYIRAEGSEFGYPKDIKRQLRKQRTAKGRELIEKYAEY